MTAHRDSATLARLRLILLGLAAIGMIGTAIELALIGHAEDFNQYIPFITIGFGVTAVVWRAVGYRVGSGRGRMWSVRAVQLAMAVMIITGLTGVVLHYRANMEFQVESDRSLGGLTLLFKVLEAKSPPALAPANMALLGLLGLAAVYRDPAPGSHVGTTSGGRT